VIKLLIESKAISNEAIEIYRLSKYQVNTIVPFTKFPITNIYLFDREELDEFLENYTGDTEVIVSISQVKGIA
jgi:hypothetical protein